MPAAQIPGFYYDTARGRYFRIQANHNAPAGSAGAQYSEDAIRERGEQQAEQAKQEEEAQRRRAVKKVQRPKHIATLTSHFLQQSGGGRPAVIARPSPATLWCSGLQKCLSPMSSTYGFPPLVARNRDDSNHSTATDRAPFQVRFTCMAWDDHNQHLLVGGSYLSNRIAEKVDIVGTHSIWASHRNVWRLSLLKRHHDISFSAYTHWNMRSVAPLHRPFDNMAIYTNDDVFQLMLTKPIATSQSDDTAVSQTHTFGPRFNSPSKERSKINMIYEASPRPMSSSSTINVMLATTRGAILVHLPEDLNQVTWQWMNRQKVEVLSADWLTENACACATRGGKVILYDPRVNSSVIRLRHGSSSFHVRALNPSQLLVAGIDDRMCLYDLRFAKQGGDASSSDSAHSFSNELVKFEHYHNRSNNQQVPVAVNSTIGAVAVAVPGQGLEIFDLWHGQRIVALENTSKDNFTSLAFSDGDDSNAGIWEADGLVTDARRARGPTLYAAKRDMLYTYS